MTRPAADRVKVLWTGTGTGTMSLGAAITGFQAFPAVLDGLVVSYSIEHQSAAEAESGFGTYTSVGNTLSRTYRTYPTLGGAAVSFTSGDKHVRLSPISLDVVPNLAIVDPTASDSITAGYRRGDFWINTATDAVWICADPGTGSDAVWRRIDVPLVFGATQTASAPSGGVSTTTLNSDTDFLICDNGSTTDCRINTPATPRNLMVHNNTGNTITITNQAAATIVSGVLNKHIALIGYNGTAWISKAVAPTLGHLKPASEISVSGTPVNYTPTAATSQGHFEGIDGALTGGADAAPVISPSNAATYALPTADRLHTNRIVTSHQANVVFQVAASSTAGSEWRIMVQHTGCTVALAAGGTLSPTTCRLVNGGIAIVTVRSNAGTAPVTEVRGNIIVPQTDVTSKTYGNDDSGQVFRLTTTDTQTFGATSGFQAGFEAVLIKEVAGTNTIDGLDNDYTLSGPDIVYVTKAGTALIASGKAGVVILDAA